MCFFLAGAGGFRTQVCAKAKLHATVSSGANSIQRKRWRGSSSQSTANKIIRTHSDERVLIILAGAGGFEPATHGFGVALNVHKALKILNFSHVSTPFSHKTVCRTCVWKLLMLF